MTEAGALDVITWAQEKAGEDRLYAVALVIDDMTRPAGQRRGLTWLLGMDANDQPVDEIEQVRFAEMLHRRGKRVVLQPGT